MIAGFRRFYCIGGVGDAFSLSRAYSAERIFVI